MQASRVTQPTWYGAEITGQRVMFLTPCGVGVESGLCMTTDGAVESVEKLEAIQALLAVE